MKTKFLAVVVASCFAVPALAQSNVSIYGVADAGIMKQSGQTLRVVSGIADGSRLGFKGSEDLGGGLKGTFELEHFLALDTGAVSADNPFWGRNARIGLAGDFGAVKLGRSQSVFFDQVIAYSPFGESRLSPARALFGGTGAFRTWNNSIGYWSPNFSGFTFGAQVALEEATDNGNDFAAYVNYGAGPLGLGFAYEKTQIAFAALPVESENDRWLFNASYDFGMVKLFGQLGETKFDAGIVSTKTDYYQFGASFPLSTAGTIMASYGQLKNKDTDIKDRIFTIGYDHNLSKRTDLYATYVNSKISIPAVASDNANTFAVGVRHSF